MGSGAHAGLACNHRYRLPSGQSRLGQMVIFFSFSRKKHGEGFLRVPVRRSQSPAGWKAARPASKQGWLEKGGDQGTDLRSSDRWVGSRPRSSAHCPWCWQRWQRRNGGTGGDRSGGGATGKGPGTGMRRLHRLRCGDGAPSPGGGAGSGGRGGPIRGRTCKEVRRSYTLHACLI